MILPTRKTDPSSDFELRLHEQLYALYPGFDHTQVDLTTFEPPRAKIDCITISRSTGIPFTDIRFLRKQLTGTVSRPNDQPRIATIHDPSNADLKFLTEHYPDAQVNMIEIAIDVRLPAGSNDLCLLRGLKLQLRHCLAPQKHKNFIDTERKFFNLDSRNNYPDAASNKNSSPTTITYFSSSKGHSVKLYLKTLDQGKPVQPPFVRTELRIETPSWAGIDFVSDLHRFGQTLRTYCSDAFYIGKGFNVDDIAGSKWKKYGATWDRKGTKKLQMQPNAGANKKFGDALSELGRAIVKATSR